VVTEVWPGNKFWSYGVKPVKKGATMAVRMTDEQVRELQAVVDSIPALKGGLTSNPTDRTWGEFCVAYVGDHAMFFALELIAVLAKNELGMPGGSQEDGVDILRGWLESLGNPKSRGSGYRTLWWWPSVTISEQASDNIG
jgi:hypothetical protein